MAFLEEIGLAVKAGAQVLSQVGPLQQKLLHFKLGSEVLVYHKVWCSTVNSLAQIMV